MYNVHDLFSCSAIEIPLNAKHQFLFCFRVLRKNLIRSLPPTIFVNLSVLEELYACLRLFCTFPL